MVKFDIDQPPYLRIVQFQMAGVTPTPDRRRP